MMKTNKVAPSLTLIAGTGVLVPGRPQTTGQPDRKIIAAGQQIEALLPALAKIHRDWARGARAAHAYCDANFPPPAFDDKADSPRSLALDLKYETTGARLADEAMSILNEKIEPLAEAIGSANARTIEGLRAKTLAVLWECIPGIADHEGFCFGDAPPCFEMLFRACISMTGLSKLAAEIETRLQLEGANNG